MNNQMQPPTLFQASEPIDITLPAQQWNVILAGLYELPYRVSQQTIDDVRRQLMMRQPAQHGQQQSPMQSMPSGLTRGENIG